MRSFSEYHNNKMMFIHRNKVLFALGFLHYRDYLASMSWHDIRAKVLSRDSYRCTANINGERCSNHADRVHHFFYDLKTLIGEKLESMVSVCEECHERMEFDGKRKRTIQEANEIWKNRVSDG